MKLLTHAMIAALTAACAVAPDGSLGPDWLVIHSHVEVLVLDMNEISDAATDPDFKLAIDRAAGVLADVDAAMEEFIETGHADFASLTLLSAIETALDVTADLLPEDAPPKARDMLLAARILLNHIAIYVPPGGSGGQPVASDGAVKVDGAQPLED